MNLQLVEAGLAWHYKQYSTDVRFEQAEKEAKSKQIGLWALPNPTPP